MPFGQSSVVGRRLAAITVAASLGMAVAGGASIAQQPAAPAPSVKPAPAKPATNGSPPASQAPAQATAPVASGPVGIWIDHTGRGAIEIARCGTDRLCGRIVWLKEPKDKQGRPLVDALNEDTSKRRRPICGLQVIGDVKPQRDGSWDNGWIYDPEQGEQFDVEIRLRGADGLQVKGYKGLKFLSETFQWTRATTPPAPRCDA